ncbi:unnamed protein product, partial [Laminaria digitata]
LATATTTAVYNAGVAIRKVKLDGRNARGTPAERPPSVESSIPASGGGGARSSLYLNGEQSHHHHHHYRRPLGASEGTQPDRRSAAGEAEVEAGAELESDPTRASSDLC